MARTAPAHALLRHHSIIDDLALLAMARRRRSGQPPGTQRITDAIAFYSSLGWMDQPQLAYPAPTPPATYDTRPARTATFSYQHITFDSGYPIPPGDPLGETWAGYVSNRVVHSWVMRHPGPQRPWMVCLHGTGMGRPLMDLGLFRANWLYHRLGINVAVPVLALHGPRRANLSDNVHFPAEDALHNLHGIRQSVWDVRRVLASLRAPGNDDIGVMGISLGGMISALVGDLDPDLSCVILGAPVAELGALIERHAQRRAAPADPRLLELSRQLDRIISPLSLPPRTPKERRYVYAGVVDKMVHPRYHAGRLWEHWERPTALWYRGGHSGLGYSRAVGRFIEQALRNHQVIGPAA